MGKIPTSRRHLRSFLFSHAEIPLCNKCKNINLKRGSLYKTFKGNLINRYFTYVAFESRTRKSILTAGVLNESDYLTNAFEENILTKKKR